MARKQAVNGQRGRWSAKAHPLIAKVLESEHARRREALERGWVLHRPAHDGPLARRRLRLLSAIFLAVNRCRCRPQLHDQDSLEASVGDSWVAVTLAPAKRSGRKSEDPSGVGRSP